MTQPQPLDLTFDPDLDVDVFFPELTPEWSEPSREAIDALLASIADAEIRDLPLPASLLPLHDHPLDLSF
ncbi:hypothetical protein [Methylorubrum thiocyanatum]|uniref:hypothetical protein n=1 Tax=Methylorubrum thiocyanatum TaxID=47958 RepID=UPI0035C83AB4